MSGFRGTGLEILCLGVMVASVHADGMVTGSRQEVEVPAWWKSGDSLIGGIGVRAGTGVNGPRLFAVFILGLVGPSQHRLSHAAVVFAVGLYVALRLFPP